MGSRTIELSLVTIQVSSPLAATHPFICKLRALPPTAAKPATYKTSFLKTFQHQKTARVNAMANTVSVMRRGRSSPLLVGVESAVVVGCKSTVEVGVVEGNGKLFHRGCT